MFDNYLVVIPTYNESGNIENLINKLSQYNFHILVVDDNSPDKTFNIVEKNKSYGKNLFAILRKKNRGYGKSVIEGFKYGIEKNYDYIVQMDSDFSHRIEDLLPMCKLSKNYDMVIGSRYISGGKVNGWGLYRKFLSKYANVFAKIITNSDINDLTTGFRIYSINLINSIDFQSIKSNGYSFLVEIIHRIDKDNYKIVEYPITFVDREVGKSKMSLKIIFESFFRLLKIYFNK
mgnify:FL=1